ncbi:MAG: hypothetical protein U1F24_03900 [Alphaproteobacteria bacterium]
MLQSAFARYYAERAEMVGMDLKELFRVGRRSSLAIGVGALAVAIAGGQPTAALAGQGYVARVATEGLHLRLGRQLAARRDFSLRMVPLAQRRRLLRRLAAALVELQPA